MDWLLLTNAILGQTSIRREVSPYEERHIPTILKGRVNCTSPVTLQQPSCNSIPKLGLSPAERLPWSGGTVRVFMAYTVVHNVSANNAKYIQ